MLVGSLGAQNQRNGCGTGLPVTLPRRTLQVAPIIERHLPPSVEMWIAAGQQATRFDRSLLPAVGRSSPRTNTPLHYGTRAPGVLE